MPLVSVIIPVYNAEAHLKKCIESLLAQTLEACEFIFVNDGSNDGSASLIEQYVDSRIVLIHQQNQGVSAARNRGLQIASGEYVGFVDADDFIEPDFFEQLYHKATSEAIDIVICRYFYFSAVGQQKSELPYPKNLLLDQQFIGKTIISHLIGNDTLNAIWNKLYRRALISEHAIWFPKGVALGEDGWFNLQCFRKAKSARFIDYAGYHYQEVPGSATRNLQSKNYFHRILEDFQQDYSSFANEFLSTEDIELLKVKKFLKKTIALLHVYYDEENNLTPLQRSTLVDEILYNETTKKNLHTYNNMLILPKSKYERIIIFALKHRLKFIIRWAIGYSNFRNKKSK